MPLNTSSSVHRANLIIPPPYTPLIVIFDLNIWQSLRLLFMNVRTHVTININRSEICFK